ncbi:helix-turn-helix domain-containing protein [Providencia vermicola]|uniref:helix-turn-helix domain-containing protein n=1 Tax=Providencia vermicola TaxID=333965 RepID=UPI002207FD7A|nr:helix-turn-helix domain-containing protein [Providencia stuartii]
MPEYYPVSRIIGNKITYYRKMKGMSLHELAIIVGVSEQQQSRYERGINRINLDRLNEYANIFGVELEKFFILNEKENQEILNTLNLRMREDE